MHCVRHDKQPKVPGYFLEHVIYQALKEHKAQKSRTSQHKAAVQKAIVDTREDQLLKSRLKAADQIYETLSEQNRKKYEERLSFQPKTDLLKRMAIRSLIALDQRISLDSG